MKPIMNINDLNTIEQMERFLTSSKTKLTVRSWPEYDNQAIPEINTCLII
jgi:hypothetical protein